MRLEKIAYAGKDPHKADRRAYTSVAESPVGSLWRCTFICLSTVSVGVILARLGLR